MVKSKGTVHPCTGTEALYKSALYLYLIQGAYKLSLDFTKPHFHKY